MATKYAENCSAKAMKGTAAMIYLSLGDVASCLDALLAAKMIPLAAQLMEAAEAVGRLPDTSHCMVLREDICLARTSVEFCHFVFDLTHSISQVFLISLTESTIHKTRSTQNYMCSIDSLSCKLVLLEFSLGIFLKRVPTRVIFGIEQHLTDD